MKRLLALPFALAIATLFALPAIPASAGTGAHAAITITSNADFTTCGCVTSGNGTAASPYVIGPWSIGAPSGGTSGWSVKVDNSSGAITDYFSIFGISSTYNDANTTDPTIWLVHIRTPTLISGNNADPTSGNDLGIGIELDNSANISIDDVDYNKGNGTGVYINGSSNIAINNSKFKATCDICSPHTGDGIYAVNSADVAIGAGADCPNSNPCVDVTYDDGFGVWLVNTSNSIIDNTAASSNDTGGYVIQGSGSYNNTVENSVSDGTGNICITYNNQKINTGYYTDLQGGLHIVDGAHDNTAVNDSFTGNSGISVGGAGNGFYYDECAGGVNEPYTGTVAGPMGAGNTFTNICYTNTNIADMPASTCKS